MGSRNVLQTNVRNEAILIVATGFSRHTQSNKLDPFIFCFSSAALVNVLRVSNRVVRRWGAASTNARVVATERDAIHAPSHTRFPAPAEPRQSLYLAEGNEKRPFQSAAFLASKFCQKCNLVCLILSSLQIGIGCKF